MSECHYFTWAVETTAATTMASTSVYRENREHLSQLQHAMHLFRNRFLWERSNRRDFYKRICKKWLRMKPKMLPQVQIVPTLSLFFWWSVGVVSAFDFIVMCWGSNFQLAAAVQCCRHTSAQVFRHKAGWAAQAHVWRDCHQTVIRCRLLRNYRIIECLDM